MPRAYDSDRQRREQKPLRFVENVDCPRCATTFDGTFHGQGTDLDDLVDPPTGTHTCPGCGRQFTTEFTGWMFHTEAG